jgi:hypothetical protein
MKPEAVTPEAPEWLPYLKESIEHWTRMSTGNRLPKEEALAGDCALCRRYNTIPLATDSINKCCIGCPVMAKTGRQFCSTTPYGRASAFGDAYGYDSDEFKAAAEEELTFLKSLLPQ